MSKKEILIHITSWIVYSMLLIFWQLDRFELINACLHSLRSVILQATLFYLNLNFFLPKVFAKDKYWQYGVLILLCIIASHFVMFYTMKILPHPIQPEPPQFRMENKGPFNPDNEVFPSLKFMMFNLFQTIPIFFFSTLPWMIDQNQKNKNREMELQNENLNSEMKFLKSQINPHFLFNALNNIYSLSYMQSEQVPHLIMKLSEMLRLVIYDSANKTIRLETEIKYIKNYIDFQKLKIEEQFNVKFITDIAEPHIPIEPMLLFPFVENAFKHSDIENNPKGYIYIHLVLQNKKLNFQVLNSYNTAPHTKDQIGGVGIENVRRRLQLSYPDRFSFNQKRENNQYEINLSMQL